MANNRDAAGAAVFVAPVENPAYDNPMARAHKFDLENPAPILDNEDEETLAAVDEAFGRLELAECACGESAQAPIQVELPNPLLVCHSPVGVAAMPYAADLDGVGIGADKEEAVITDAQP